MTENLQLLGLRHVIAIRNYQSASSRGSCARKAYFKKRLMKLSLQSMRPLNIKQLLMWPLRNLTRCRALNPKFKFAEFRVCLPVKVLASPSSRRYYANCSCKRVNYLPVFKCSVSRSAVATTAAA